MNHCLMLQNRRKAPRMIPDGAGGFLEDYRVRPGTPTPDKHWTGMVLARFNGPSDHIQVCGSTTPGGGPELWISRKLKDENPEGFGWLMRFARSENLAFQTVQEECQKCDGSRSCIALQEAVPSQEKLS